MMHRWTRCVGFASLVWIAGCAANTDGLDTPGSDTALTQGLVWSPPSNPGQEIRMTDPSSEIQVAEAFVYDPRQLFAIDVRTLVVTFDVPNHQINKDIDVSIGAFPEISVKHLRESPSREPPGGEAFARYLGNQDGRDRFQVVASWFRATDLDSALRGGIEATIKVRQGGVTSLQRVQMRWRDALVGNPLQFKLVGAPATGEVLVTKAVIASKPAEGRLDLDLDVANLSFRKRFFVNCVTCSASNRVVKRLDWTSGESAANRAVFLSQQPDGKRENVRLQLSPLQNEKWAGQTLQIEYLVDFNDPPRAGTLSDPSGLGGQRFFT